MVVPTLKNFHYSLVRFVIASVAVCAFVGAAQFGSTPLKPDEEQGIQKPSSPASQTTASPGKKHFFELDVLPILKTHCVQCHGSPQRLSELDLSTLAGVMKGGGLGKVVIPRNPDESSLYKVVHDGSMPKGGKQLSKDELAIIRAWIQEGALSAVTFEENVLPILQANCVRCHGSEMRHMNMNLSTLAGVLKGSESGPVLTPGMPDQSLLYKKVRDGLMPKGGKPLSENDVKTIRTWIEAGGASASTDTSAATHLTQHDILPTLLLRCNVCHGPRRQEGGLALHTRDAILKGGKSGPAIVLGKPDQSLIIQKIRAGEMPPKKKLSEFSIKLITQSETERLARWIEQGAPEGNASDLMGTESDSLISDKDRQFWSFQPPQKPQVPKVRRVDRVRNPIDAFILSNLEKKGLSLSPEADLLTLIRRASFDLTGLPPTRDEVNAFLLDRDPNAYDKMIDRLLESPRYGERWGRYWLDLAGYADSEGGKLNDDAPRLYAWRYRDYVIRSFNADKPYDRFLHEQIAGDELEDYEHASVVTEQMMDNLVATGFLRMIPDSTYHPTVDFAEDRLDVIDDAIGVLGSGVMGLTIRCARCHSHKFDPIPQRDYYRLMAVFKGAYDNYNWLQSNVTTRALKYPARYLPYTRPGATPAELMKEQQEREWQNTKLDRQIEELRATLEEKAEPIKQKMRELKLSALPPVLQEDLRKALATPKEQRTEIQKYLVEKFDKTFQVKPGELKQIDADYKKTAEEIGRRIKQLEAKKILEPKIRALWDQGDPSPTYLLRRGDPANAGPLVEPGVPTILTDGKTPFVTSPPWPGANKTGRRLAFARWLTGPENPLTARVMVNRIWAHHFGAGIVPSLGNFGRVGETPTHPELLDWLATEFVRQGWRIKAMHRLMMTSSTYRQVSLVTPEIERLDLDNKLVSRMPLRRLDAEALHDAMLLISGRLDETRYGPPDPVEVRDDGLILPIWSEKGGRRAVYVKQRRTELPTLMVNFDLPAMAPNCIKRENSTVALQALTLMNDGRVYEIADSLAERVKKEAGTHPAKQIEAAFWMVLSRPPTEEEKKVSLEMLNRILPSVKDNANAMAKLCQVLMNSAAFLYVD